MKTPTRNQAHEIKQRRIERWLTLFICIGLILGLIFGNRQYQQYRLHRFDHYAIRGISLSQQDGYVDFVALKNAGQNFVYLRATQGSIFADNDFNDNYQRSLGSGMNVGVYHVFSFDSRVTTQVSNFVKTVGNNTGNLPIAIQILDPDLTNRQLNVFKNFIRLLKRQYHHEKFLIWTTATIFNQVKGPNLLLWDQNFNQDLGHLCEVNSAQPIEVDGQTQTFHQSVFNGNDHQWQKYLSN